jgi:hypothetical protein
MAACAVLACGGLLRAAELSTADSTTGAAAVNPTMADDAPVRKPLMAGLDQIGLAKPLDAAGITIGGYVEGSWAFDANHPTGNYFTGRAFDNEQESVLLDQLDLSISRPVDATKNKFDIGFTIEQIYGADAAFLHANGLTTYSPSKILGAYTAGPERIPKNQYDLNQAFVQFAVPVGKGLTLTAGKFVTLLGYETINPTLNPFFSHSFLFMEIPLTHTGVLASYNLTDTLSITGGITRGWEQALKDTNGSLDGIGEIKYAKDKWTLILNGTTGDEQADTPLGVPGHNGWRTALDLVAQYAYSDNLKLGLNADYGIEPQVAANGSTGQWYGAAAYAGYTVSSMFTLNARAEWFDDENGSAPTNLSAFAHVANTYYELTLGVAIKPFPTNNIGSNLVIRPEVRLDYANKPAWAGDNTHDQLTAALEAYFTF